MQPRSAAGVGSAGGCELRRMRCLHPDRCVALLDDRCVPKICERCRDRKREPRRRNLLAVCNTLAIKKESCSMTPRRRDPKERIRLLRALDYGGSPDVAFHASGKYRNFSSFET